MTTSRHISLAAGFARNAGMSANPGLWKGLVAMWAPMLGPTGTRLIDYSGNGFHGTLGAAPANIFSWGVNKEYGYHIKFPATMVRNDVIRNTSVSFTHTPSTLLFVGTEGNTINQIVMGFYNGAAENGVRRVTGDNWDGVAVGDAGFGSTGDVTASDYAFVSAAMRTSTGVMDFYLSDRQKPVFMGTGTKSDTYPATATRVSLGGDGNFDNRLTGGSVSLAIWYNRALSIGEIAEWMRDPLGLLRLKRRPAWRVPTAPPAPTLIQRTLTGVGI